MFKVSLLIALAIAGACAQELAAPQGEAAPEPYSYGYETDSHSASEQRDPSGKVTGFYTLVDADGRQRRVEYFADESGFHAKVQTNEIGTKSENSADVEILAAPPTPGQLELQPQAPVVSQQSVITQQPQLSGSYYQTSYSPSVQGSSYYTVPSQYGYGVSSQYGTGYGSVYGGYTGAAPGSSFTSYNNHLPASYYRSISTVQPVGSSYTSTVGAPSVNYRSYGYQTVAPSVSYQTVPAGQYQAVGNYRTYGVPGSVSYQTVGVPGVNYQVNSVTSRPVSSLSGSSNYVLLKKRAAVEKN